MSSLVIPATPPKKNNVIDSLKEGREVKVPVDNPGNPSFIEDVSKSILELVKKERTGIWHVETL